MTARANLRYGVDGAPYVLGLTAAALGSVAVAAGAARGPRARRTALALAALAGTPAVLGIRYVLRGKLALRERLLGEVVWRGDEVVADLGSGAGLLGIGAAHKTTGAVHCVDLFISTDLLGGSPQRLAQNARREGVDSRIEIHREDVRALSLGDDSVDVVLSTLCLHNLADAGGRRQALAEIARILRPGGAAVISDLAHVNGEYAPALRHAGLDVRLAGRLPGTFPPQQALVARAPRPRTRDDGRRA